MTQTEPVPPTSPLNVAIRGPNSQYDNVFNMNPVNKNCLIGNDRHSSFLHDNWWLLNYLFDILYMKPMCYHAWDKSVKHICQYFLIKRNRTQPMPIYILQYSQWCVCSYKDQHSTKNSCHESCLKNHMVITPDDYQYCHFMACCLHHIIDSRW